jgi:hypothetical protein
VSNQEFQSLFTNENDIDLHLQTKV